MKQFDLGTSNDESEHENNSCGTFQIFFVLITITITNHWQQTLGIVLENNYSKIRYRKYQGPSKNIGGYLNKLVKRSSYFEYFQSFALWK